MRTGHRYVLDDLLSKEGTPRAKRKTGEEAVYAGFALLLSERRAVVSSRGGERPALGTRRHPRQDRKALRKPGFPRHWSWAQEQCRD